MTPDSFSDGGKFVDAEGECIDIDGAIAYAYELVDQGAAIIDVGGESTRPGADPVDPEEEWNRIGGVVERLSKENICVSVDTRHVEVAEKAIAQGASIINDISGFSDPKMMELAANSNVGLVLMHMRGTPQTMQDDTSYDDVVGEVCEYLDERASSLQARGVKKARICIDPGPGFGKNASQTIELMRNIHEFVHFGYPVMVAVSRKSFLKSAYHIDDNDLAARDEASAQEAAMACELGASIVRTHNVEATVKSLDSLRPYAILGLGSNIALVANEGEEIEGKRAQIDLAIAALCQLPDSLIIDISPYYLSEPAYMEDQEEFVNCVVLLRTGIPPKELLAYLHAIEATLGRTREIENGPRTIDIDIVDFQLYTAISDELTLPHPRAIDRDFVVKPLSDILPGHVLADGVRIDTIPEDKRLGRARRL